MQKTRLDLLSTVVIEKSLLLFIIIEVQSHCIVFNVFGTCTQRGKNIKKISEYLDMTQYLKTHNLINKNIIHTLNSPGAHIPEVFFHTTNIYIIISMWNFTYT